jgi:hypothetical protein
MTIHDQASDPRFLLHLLIGTSGTTPSRSISDRRLARKRSRPAAETPLVRKGRWRRASFWAHLNAGWETNPMRCQDLYIFVFLLMVGTTISKLNPNLAANPPNMQKWGFGNDGDQSGPNMHLLPSLARWYSHSASPYCMYMNLDAFLATSMQRISCFVHRRYRCGLTRSC